MTEEEQKRFEGANKVVHPVEKQWHYPILTKYGFKPITKEATGFVRSYLYQNAAGMQIKCCTGASADHWEALKLERWKGGLWGDLEPYLKSLPSKDRKQ